MSSRDILTEKCIHCGRCTSVCEFLTKYGLDLDGFNEREDLAYSCFLCGDCRRVCPVDIDGKKISLLMREEEVEENSGKTQKGYGLVKLEKNRYKFKNYGLAKGKSSLYPGCNFLSFYPETSDKMIQLFKENGIGTIFDCCSKPISELGMEKDSITSVEYLNEYISKNNIDELVMVCPNCYYFLKDKVNAKCVSVYQKLEELGLGKWIEPNIGVVDSVYIPCPDRDSKYLYNELNRFTDIDSYTKSKSQCCGLGGLAGVKEPELSEKMNTKLRENEGKIHTYCATCAGNINRKEPGKAVHFLTEILDVNEDSSTGLKTIVNRAKYRFRK